MEKTISIQLKEKEHTLYEGESFTLTQRASIRGIFFWRNPVISEIKMINKNGVLLIETKAYLCTK